MDVAFSLLLSDLVCFPSSRYLHDTEITRKHEVKYAENDDRLLKTWWMNSRLHEEVWTFLKDYTVVSGNVIGLEPGFTPRGERYTEFLSREFTKLEPWKTTMESPLGKCFSADCRGLLDPWRFLGQSLENWSTKHKTS